mmetsp:Transcript_11340/g.23882  ORF Transcript_11340/g.23882 Transcript_11340/m.23882 type:complete len:215 (-) Transcript_11340:293-937(-)
MTNAIGRIGPDSIGRGGRTMLSDAAFIIACGARLLVLLQYRNRLLPTEGGIVLLVTLLGLLPAIVAARLLLPRQRPRRRRWRRLAPLPRSRLRPPNGLLSPLPTLLGRRWERHSSSRLVLSSPLGRFERYRCRRRRTEQRHRLCSSGCTFTRRSAVPAAPRPAPRLSRRARSDRSSTGSSRPASRTIGAAPSVDTLPVDGLVCLPRRRFLASEG